MAFRILCISNKPDWIASLHKNLAGDFVDYEIESTDDIGRLSDSKAGFNLIIMNRDTAAAQDLLTTANLSEIPPIIQLSDNHLVEKIPVSTPHIPSSFYLSEDNTHELLEIIKQCAKNEWKASQYIGNDAGPKEGYLKASIRGEIIFADIALCKMLGYTSQELVGTNLLETQLLGDLTLDGFSSGETEVTHGNGTSFWIRITTMPNRNLHGELEDISIVVQFNNTRKAQKIGRYILDKVSKAICSEDCTKKVFGMIAVELEGHLPEGTHFEIFFNDQTPPFDDQKWNDSVGNSDRNSVPSSIINNIGAGDPSSYQEEALSSIDSFNEAPETPVEKLKFHHCDLLDAKMQCYGHIIFYSFGTTIQLSDYQQQLIQFLCFNFHSIIDRVKINQDYSKILNLSEDLICIVNKSGIIRYANPAFFLKLGTPTNLIVGKPVYELFHPEEKISHKSLIRMLNSGRQRFKFETKMMTSSNFVRDITWTAISKKSDDSFYCIGHDFTEKRIYQDQIKKSEMRYRGLFEGMNEGLIESDSFGKIISVNPGLCKMLGYSNDELVGENQYALLHDEKTATRLKNKVKYRKLGKVGLYEAVFIHKDGSEVWTEISTNPIFDSSAKFQGIISIVLNITQRKHAEQQAFKIKEAFTKALETKVNERTRELEFARNELSISLQKEQYLSKLKSRFVSMASHQFRTPLSIILSNLGILSMHLEDKESVQNMNIAQLQEKFDTIHVRIQQQVKKMTDLMNDVLILGNISDGNIKRRIELQSIVQVCEDLIASYNSLSDTQDFKFEIIGKPVALKFDKQLMEHALSNLMSNAIKYSFPETTPLLTLHFGSVYVQIKVCNQGIGIPEDELEYIFDPFYRASNAKTYQGTGLGTSIVKEYLEYMNATIDVQSTIDQDTTFTINLKI